MSQYLLLNHIQVQNANCIAGFTWGFPAITHFMGFTHNLQRQINDNFGLTFAGCAVICHDFQTHTYRSLLGQDTQFIQSKNPPYLKKHKPDETPPIIEEGRMNITISLIIKIDKEWSGTVDNKASLENTIECLCQTNRIAGGLVLAIDKVTLLNSRTDEEQRLVQRRLKQHLVPGFILMDRSNYLEEHFHNKQAEQPETELLDAWLNFSALRYKAALKETKDITEPTEKDLADWVLCDKPFKGWLVPIMVGYRAISPVYKEGEVLNLRDKETPSTFVESIHSIGEWLSPTRLDHIDNAIWHYCSEEEWYLCQQPSAALTSQSSNQSQENTQITHLSFDDALANL